MNEELYKRLCKIKALADRGVGGEQDNAKELLRSILAQHGLTERDFDAFGEKETRMEVRFKDQDSYEAALFEQVARSLELTVYHYRKEIASSKGKTWFVRGSQSKVAQFEMTYNIYLDAWKEELEIAYTAFINLNRIFPPRKDDDDVERPRRELTAVERKAIMRASQMERVKIQKRLT